MKVSINAIEFYLPPNTEDGSFLKRDNPTWCMEDIEEKTGIRKRHISGQGETATDMAFLAAQKMLVDKVNALEIDFLILVTQSPDYILPTSACILQDRLSLKKTCISFDVNLGCSGFIYGLAIGGALIDSGLAKQGLLVCSETYTKYIDKQDRTCRPLFSDGAAATHLISAPNAQLGPFDFGTDGSGFGDLIVPFGGARNMRQGATEKKLIMKGSKVFMFTMAIVLDCVKSLLAKSGKEIETIDLFIFHQASKIVLDSIIRQLKLPNEKVFVNYEEIGNTVSATIPIALSEAVQQNRLKDGDQVMLVGFGVGYSWGGCLVRWGR